MSVMLNERSSGLELCGPSMQARHCGFRLWKSLLLSVEELTVYGKIFQIPVHLRHVGAGRHGGISAFGTIYSGLEAVARTQNAACPAW